VFKVPKREMVFKQVIEFLLQVISQVKVHRIILIEKEWLSRPGKMYLILCTMYVSYSGVYLSGGLFIY
jgi:hypothetical protein